MQYTATKVEPSPGPHPRPDELGAPLRRILCFVVGARYGAHRQLVLLLDARITNTSCQAFKVAISVDSNHAESFNNLGILELRKGNVDQARTNFQTAARLAEHMHEPFFNGGLLAFKLGDFQESFTLTTKALDVYPDHAESLELKRQLKQHFTSL